MEARTIGVIGGGITGLSAQHFLSRSKSPFQISAKLYERSSRVGGWTATSTRTYGAKGAVHMFERGPRSIRGSAAGHVTLGLVSLAGLGPKLLSPSSQAGKRLLYMHGRVVKLPSTLLEAVQSPILRYLPAFAWDFILTRSPASTKDESIGEFLRRYVGEAVTRDIVGGVVVGIYGGNLERLSMRSCFAAFHEAAVRRGSLVRGLLLSNPSPSYIDSVATALQMSATERAQYEEVVQRVKSAGGMFSFADGGVGALAKRLRELHHSDIELDCTLIGISKPASSANSSSSSSSSKLNLHFARSSGITGGQQDERIVTVDRAIAALPSYSLAPAIRSLSPNASNLLSEIEFAHMALVSLAFEQQPGQELIKPEHRGFGYLIPPVENRAVLGISFDSLTFPTVSGPSLLRMCVMIGGDLTNNKHTVDVTKASEQALLDIALDAVRQDLKITVPPVSTDVFIAKNAIPQYVVGHEERMRAIESYLDRDIPQLHLAGASYYGVSVNDCALSGMKAAISAVAKL